MKNSTAAIDHRNALFFGLDVHKKTIVIARAEAKGEPRYVKTLDNRGDLIVDYFKAVLAQSKGPVHVTYEAGGCGYHLERRLREIGVIIIVASPAKLRKARKEVKNDKRDAIKLAKLLRNQIILAENELHAVHVPDPDDEAMREKTRQRQVFRTDVRRTKNQISSMLQRHGIRYTLTKHEWTKTFRSWLERVDFKNPNLQSTFRVYLDKLADEEARLEACVQELHEMCERWNRALVVKALCALRGIQELTGISLVAEIGSFARFDTAPAFMGFLGLTPSESSSGESVTRGRITKTGNKRARTLLVEAACCAYRKPKSKKAFVESCPKGLPAEVIEPAYRAQIRAHKTYWKLVNRGKNTNAARTAVARELAGFVWALATTMEASLEARDAKAA